MINLKLAEEGDFEDLKKMSLSFLDESPYRDFKRDNSKIDTLVNSFLVTDKEKVCIIAIYKDKPIGMIAGVLSESLFSQDQVASELVWWIDPKNRRKSKAALELLGAFEHWAKISGAVFIQMQCLPGLNGDTVGRIYERLGYKLTEIAYVKELN